MTQEAMVIGTADMEQEAVLASDGAGRECSCTSPLFKVSS